MSLLETFGDAITKMCEKWIQKGSKDADTIRDTKVDTSEDYWNYTKTSFTYHMHKIRNKIEAILKKIFLSLKNLWIDMIQNYS